MKSIFYLGILACFYSLSPLPAWAQKMIYNREKRVFNINDKPYIGLVQVGGGDFTASDYSIRTLAGKEIIVLRANKRKGYYEVLFMATLEKGYHDDYNMSPRDAAKLVYDNDLVKGDSLDGEAKRRFMYLYGKELRPDKIDDGKYTLGDAVDEIDDVATKLFKGEGEKRDRTTRETPQTPQPPQTPTNADYQTIERNKAHPIYISFDEISQGVIVIGKYTEKVEHTAGKPVTYMQITFPNGSAVAEIKGEGILPDVYEIFTFADRRSYTFKVQVATNPKKELVQFLIDKRYL